jgi:hypothetical protein
VSGPREASAGRSRWCFDLSQELNQPGVYLTVTIGTENNALRDFLFDSIKRLPQPKSLTEGKRLVSQMVKVETAFFGFVADLAALRFRKTNERGNIHS